MEHAAERLFKPRGVPHPPERKEAVVHLNLPAALSMKREMKMDSVAVLNRTCVWGNQTLLWIGAAFLVMMIVLTCSNIFLRMVWTPIKGTFELMGFFSAVVTAFALGYTQMQKGHTGIDVVVNLFSKSTRRIINGINNLILTAFFCILGWQLMTWGATLLKVGEVTETLGIAFNPFVCGVGIGCFGLALVLLVELLKIFRQDKGV